MTPESRKVALVTGCSEPSSLGAAISLDLLHRGFRVYATARKVSSMKELEKEGCDVLALDVVDSVSIRTAAEVVEQTCGRLDVLVNNAGVSGWAPALDTDPVALLEMYNINVVGPLRVTQHFSDLLVSTANSRTLGAGRSVVLNVTSVARYGTAWQCGYSSSKAALHVTSEEMRREMSGLGVQVVTVELGPVKTAMFLKAKPYEISSPATSKYYGNFPSIRVKLDANREKMVGNVPSPADAAKTIVNAAVTSASPVVHAGGMAGFFKWVWPYLPRGLGEGITRKMCNLTDVERPVFL